MLVALGAFLGRLIGESNDTRLLFIRLIQLQVFHSFDLPRRRLGYSIVIGLICWALPLESDVSLCTSVTAIFSDRLPVLVLDYRSRLGLSKSGIEADLLLLLLFLPNV